MTENSQFIYTDCSSVVNAHKIHAALLIKQSQLQAEPTIVTSNLIYLMMPESSREELKSMRAKTRGKIKLTANQNTLCQIMIYRRNWVLHISRM
jgi:hypothetical protein